MDDQADVSIPFTILISIALLSSLVYGINSFALRYQQQIIQNQNNQNQNNNIAQQQQQQVLNFNNYTQQQGQTQNIQQNGLIQANINNQFNPQQQNGNYVFQ
ncbi:hypothetical protein PPERSA_06220 [Pseudocohnilembus persalinus]|uniref:Transmembrane protein n=1 Tax=Pseudocohnilembus persalinus TaxID=266149 RepID=A0A0V0R183_PSEPJ|nr:hypothetical protein PPERSA_06220 [Pseudocohnilembus persalinus]|eukprot:KRX08042.1 hypothetical protein PPERSA_06220 [Pseudocohnilembus persalinus]